MTEDIFRKLFTDLNTWKLSNWILVNVTINDGISLFDLFDFLKHNHRARYISNALIITRNFGRNSSIKIKISQSQRNERDSIPSRQISNRSNAQFPINRLFQPDIYIKPVSMAIKNTLERKLYIREAVIHRPAFEKRLTRTNCETIVREGKGEEIRDPWWNDFKIARINAGISKMTPIRYGEQKTWRIRGSK